jgi:ribose 5-phosphate isomerase
MLTGVVEVGLFCKMARAAYFGNTVRKKMECLVRTVLTFVPLRMDL